MPYELKTLERALDLLLELAAMQPQRLVDLTTTLEVNQTSVLRTLRVLEARGMVRRSSGQDYSLGPRLIELGQAAVEGLDVLESLRPWAISLSRSLAVTVHVGMLRGNAVTVIAKADAPEGRVKYSTLGTRMPLHATAAGKAALALREAAGEEPTRPADQLQAYTPHTITSVEDLSRDVAATVERGFSVELEEFNMGFCCVGSAFEIDGDIYTVSVSGLRIDESALLDRANMLLTSLSDFLTDYAGAVRTLHRSPSPAT